MKSKYGKIIILFLILFDIFSCIFTQKKLFIHKHLPFATAGNKLLFGAKPIQVEA
jgi:hypothetical protein